MNAILSTDTLRSIAPSIFAPAPWEKVSNNYRFVPTEEVLGMMKDQGFHPVTVSQSRCRIPGKQPFCKHMVRLRHLDHLGQSMRDEVPELVLVNSHDRSSAYKLYAGIMRTVCENGLVSQSVDHGSFSLRHSGSRDLRQQVIHTTGEVIGVTRLALEKIEEWKGISLTRPQQLAFATAALEIKDGSPIEPRQLLEPRRVEDAPAPDGTRDLYRTMNTAQEHLIRGGLQGRASTGRRVTTRPIKAVDSDIRTNRALWRLAEEMARLV